MTVDWVAGFAAECQARLDWTPDVIDLGGGLGIQYVAGEPAPSWDSFLDAVLGRLEQAWSRARPAAAPNRPRAGPVADRPRRDSPCTAWERSSRRVRRERTSRSTAACRTIRGRSSTARATRAAREPRRRACRRAPTGLRQALRVGRRADPAHRAARAAARRPAGRPGTGAYTLAWVELQRGAAPGRGAGVGRPREGHPAGARRSTTCWRPRFERDTKTRRELAQGFRRGFANGEKWARLGIEPGTSACEGGAGGFSLLRLASDPASRADSASRPQPAETRCWFQNGSMTFSAGQLNLRRVKRTAPCAGWAAPGADLSRRTRTEAPRVRRSPQLRQRLERATRGNVKRCIQIPRCRVNRFLVVGSVRQLAFNRGAKLAFDRLELDREIGLRTVRDSEQS